MRCHPAPVPGRRRPARRGARSAARAARARGIVVLGGGPGGLPAAIAAALAVRYGCDPREVGEKHIRELQQTLLKNDCYIPGHPNEDEADLARRASVTASSETAGGEAANVINGYSRGVGEANRRCPGPNGRFDWAAIGQVLHEIGYEDDVVMEPFVRMGGQVGRDVSLWRDLSGGADDAKLDQDAAASLRWLRGVMEGSN